MVEHHENGRNWHIIATSPEGDKDRVREVVTLNTQDFPSNDEFWKEFQKRKVELSDKYGWSHISTGSGSNFTSFFGAWSDEYIVGGQD